MMSEKIEKELLSEYKFKKLDLCKQRIHLIEVRNYLNRFPACKFGSPEFNRSSNLLNSLDFCRHHVISIYRTFKLLLMKTPKKPIRPAVHDSPYELFQLKNGTWKWRKRAKNKKILNHSYNTKAAAIKGMRADFNVTNEMDSFEFREVEK